MDIRQALLEERERIDRALTELGGSKVGDRVVATDLERGSEASDRMKRYWADRKAAKLAGKGVKAPTPSRPPHKK